MDRQEFLKVYHQLKGDIVEREDNQFADVAGDLVTVDIYEKYEYDGVEGIITTYGWGDEVGDL